MVSLVVNADRGLRHVLSQPANDLDAIEVAATAMHQQARPVDLRHDISQVEADQVLPAGDQRLRGQQPQRLAQLLPAAAIGLVAGTGLVIETMGGEPQHGLGEVLAQFGQQRRGATLAEVAVDAVLPRCVGHQFGRLVDEAQRADLRRTVVANVLPQRQRAHRVADEAGAAQLQGIDQVVEIARHPRCRRDIAACRRMTAVATGIPAKHTMVLGQLMNKRRPFEVAGSPAVEKNQGWAPVTVLPDRQRFAIVGSEAQG